LAEPIISKAAILEKLGEPLVVDYMELPKKLDIGQVLVRVHASGICGTQINEISAKEDKYLPHLLGHEGGGVVIKVGAGVTHVKEGDHVVMHWRKGEGIESGFPKYIPKYKWHNDSGIVGGGLVTTFNEHAVVSENRLTPISKDISFDIAALMGCAVTTGLGVVFNEACLKPGESIAVVGCGGVGLNVIQAAALVSASPIIAIDVYNHKLDMARRFGATHVFNAVEFGLLSVIDEIRDTIGKVDVAVECAGKADWIMSIVARAGRVVFAGLPKPGQNFRLGITRQNFNGSSIIFSEGGSTNPSTDIMRYLKLYRQGRLKLDELITHRFALDDINTAIDVVKSGVCGRCIINMEEKDG